MHTAHLFLLAMWGGLVAAELVMEAVCRAPERAALAAEIHFWLDVILELPLIAGVIATGAVLLARGWPPDARHALKLALAGAAIATNLYCVGVVIRRRARRDDALALERLQRRVFWSALGVPFGLAALYLGLAHAGVR
jgi:hypothetical protein